MNLLIYNIIFLYMSGITYDPPTEDVPIFDASLFVVDNVGLTAAQGDLRYLKFPNAQGTENLTAITVSGTAQFNNTITGLKEITLVDTLINPSHTIIINPKLTGSAITVRDTDNVLEIDTGDIAIKSTSIEQADGLPLSIGTGENIFLDVGTGSRSVAGVVHHYSDGDDAVVGSGVHLNNGLNNLSATNIHNGTNSVGQLNLASGTGSSTAIVMGNTNTTTSLRGTTTISIAKTNQIETTTPSEVGLLYWNTTTGSISFAQSQSSGLLNIGTLPTRSGAINIGSGGSSTSPITIGNETVNTTTTNLLGNTTITKPFMNVISATTATSTPSLFNNTTTGNIQLANGQTTGSFSIGGGLSRTGSISIGQSTQGNILIGTSMISGTNLITMGTSSLGTVTLRGQNIRLNDGGTGSIDIGNPSAGTVTINRPLSVGYVSSAISGNNQIGFTISSKLAGPTLTGSVPNSLSNLTNIVLPNGVWSLSANSRAPAGGIGINYFLFTVSSSSSTMDDYQQWVCHTDGSGYYYQGGLSCVVSGGTWYLNVQHSFSSAQTLYFTSLVATRIA